RGKRPSLKNGDWLRAHGGMFETRHCGEVPVPPFSTFLLLRLLRPFRPFHRSAAVGRRPKIIRRPWSAVQRKNRRPPIRDALPQRNSAPQTAGFRTIFKIPAENLQVPCPVARLNFGSSYRGTVIGDRGLGTGDWRLATGD